MKKILLAVAIILFGIAPALAEGTYGGGNKRSGGREDYAALAGATYGSSSQIYTAWGGSPEGAEYNALRRCENNGNSSCEIVKTLDIGECVFITNNGAGWKWSGSRRRAESICEVSSKCVTVRRCAPRNN
ncbi:MAG: DUF4189 domain-containing protein [Blastochloris viridis]|uniref:DUF4189 domain-containing protein n=1 Tax=Blastochloris viridis TaxID=1079 RepID=A0A6N4R496_BLAVI|nr:MAG: DUF4189 domain-containing protein [Blastochloris viridis]